MDAEKNVVEAARAVVKEATHIHRDVCPIRATLINNLESALSAYDSAPAPSEDRVREAAEAVDAALTKWQRNPSDPRFMTEVWAEVLRPYVTPAPALPAGTVAVSVETLKEWRDRAERVIASCYDGSQSSIRSKRTRYEISRILMSPPRPEPPKELVRKWELEAEKWAASRFLENPLSARIGYVAALRAAWEAKGGA